MKYKTYKRHIQSKRIQKKSKKTRRIHKQSKRIQSKRIRNKSKRIRKHTGGSFTYYMGNGDYIENDDTYETQPFFKKVFDIPSDKSKNEFKISEILKANPHPNIVTFYQIKPYEYITMEELITYATDQDYAEKYLDNKKELIKQIETMREVKAFLQSLGIIYLDWKFDNIGKSKDGNYKLFDFDASGQIDLSSGSWKIVPLYLNSYNGDEKYLSPTDLDDWAFERNIIDESKRMMY